MKIDRSAGSARIRVKWHDWFGVYRRGESDVCHEVK